MLQLPQIPNKIIPLTIEEYNCTTTKGRISEESLIKCENREGVEKKADNIVGWVEFILSILIGCWISNKVVAPINEVSGALLTAWIMFAAGVGLFAFCILATITLFLLKIDKFVENKIFNKIYAAEIDFNLKKREKEERAIKEENEKFKQLARQLPLSVDELKRLYSTNMPSPKIDCYFAYRDWFLLYESYLCEKEKRKSVSYWRNLGNNGREFEKEICRFFLERGFSAKLTPQSNDGGIDIILNKDGVVTYVQCKQYAQKIGIQVARELYGVMCANNVSNGIIATLEGVNDNTQKFCEANSIQVLTVYDYIPQGILCSTTIDENKYRDAYYKGVFYRHDENDLWVCSTQFLNKQDAKDYIIRDAVLSNAPFIAIHKSYKYEIYGLICSWDYNLLKEMFNSQQCGIIEIICQANN